MGQKTAITLPNYIRSAYNMSGVAIAKGVAVKKTTTGITLVTASTDIIWGVTMEIIPIAGFGNVQIDGKAVMVAGAVTTAGGLLMADGSGRAIDFVAAAGNYVLGLEGSVQGYAATGAADLMEVELRLGRSVT